MPNTYFQPYNLLYEILDDTSEILDSFGNLQQIKLEGMVVLLTIESVIQRIIYNIKTLLYLNFKLKMLKSKIDSFKSSFTQDYGENQIKHFNNKIILISKNWATISKNFKLLNKNRQMKKALDKFLTCMYKLDLMLYSYNMEHSSRILTLKEQKNEK